MIRGGLALGEGSSVKMGAKLYGANTFGPHCKIGGEVTNSIFQGYSNKGHDGYLGNSVIGEWCNFGADTNSSNLKNNYKKVSIYNHKTDTLIDSGQQFLGLIMGDHSKTGINTMLNTGTVVGVSSNIFGAGFPPTHVPSFTWGNDDNPNTYLLDKALEVAKAVMARRNIEHHIRTHLKIQEISLAIPRKFLDKSAQSPGQSSCRKSRFRHGATLR